MSGCWLSGHGSCGGKLSGEHYIPACVLRLLSAGNSTAVIGGMKWQPPNTLQRIGIATLKTKLYCRKHNSSLSPLDSTLEKFLKAVRDIDKTPERAGRLVQVRGPLLERALLKTVVGLTAANRGISALQDKWKVCLSGGGWPAGWGLYLASPKDPQIMDGDFHYVSREARGRIVVADFHLGGVLMSLLLGVPGVPRAWGMYQPRGVIVERTEGEFRIELLWPRNSNECLTLTRLPYTTRESSPRARGWAGPA